MKSILHFIKITVFFFAFFCTTQIYAQRPFITVWNINTLYLTISLNGQYTYTWENTEDSKIKGEGSGIDNLSLRFPKPGLYRLSLTPTGKTSLHRIQSEYGHYDGYLNRGLQNIEQWGDVKWSSMQAAFAGQKDMIITATDAPDLSQVTDMSEMFSEATTFNQSINHWNVSNVTNMSRIFWEAKAFNQPLDKWDVSNVTDMSNMFANAIAFNQPVNNWNVSKVLNMYSLFYNAENFNQPLNKWDVSNVSTMSDMFNGAQAFNQPLEQWDTSQVVGMERMFENAKVFNQPLNNWDVNKVIYMHEMFKNAKAFNQLLTKWHVNESVYISEIFLYSGLSFNKSIKIIKKWEKKFNKKLKPKKSFITLWYLNSSNVPLWLFLRGQYFYTWENIDFPEITGSSIGENDLKITIPKAGTYRLILTPIEITPLHFINYDFPNRNSTREDVLLEIQQWGDVQWSNLENAFNSAAEMKLTAVDIPNLDNVRNMAYMFAHTRNFNQPINHWKVSKVTNMRGMFLGAQTFNQPLDKWDVSKVYDMSDMFSNTETFNQPLNNWDVSNVTNMSRIFFNAKAFNQPLDNWKINEKAEMYEMFKNAKAFNQPLNSEKWNNINKKPEGIEPESLIICIPPEKIPSEELFKADM